MCLKDKCGTFSYCTKCKNSQCCISFDKINAPTLNIREIETINKEHANFYNEKDNDLYELKTNDNTCIFFQNNKCIIYNNRPLDCRLYPFDIIRQGARFFLILYELDCIDTQKFLPNIDKIDIIVEKIKPWIEKFTHESNYTKMINIKYRVIKEINL